MKKIPPARPEMNEEMVQAATEALRNERMVMGESVFKFEEAFARYTGVKHAISVSSGTDALILTFIAMGVAGKEVLTSPLTFIASANSILHASGIPRFVDADRNDYNIMAKTLRSAVTEDTAGILPVHLFGHPCQMDELMDIADEKDLMVVEDACQAHGAKFKGRKAGALGHAGCFSFYPTKNMTVGGDGGMITTNDDDLAKQVAKLRDCGRISRYVHDIIGFTSRLNSMNAAIGLVQLKHLDDWNERRREIASRYDRELKDIKSVRIPPGPSKNVEPVYHLYAITADDRDALADHLAKNGIETGVHYPVPVHEQPVYRDLFHYMGGEYPNSEFLSHRLLSLPMFPSLKDEEVDRVCETISDFYGGCR